MGFYPLPTGSVASRAVWQRGLRDTMLLTLRGPGRREEERREEGRRGVVTSVNSMSLRDRFAPSRDHLSGGPVTWESRWQFMKEHGFALPVGIPHTW